MPSSKPQMSSNGLRPTLKVLTYCVNYLGLALLEENYLQSQTNRNRYRDRAVPALY